jgi:hypothetical protein
MDKGTMRTACAQPCVNGEMDEGMCGLYRGKKTGFGFAESEERSHEPDESVLLRWKTSLETFVAVVKEKDG